MKLVTVVRKKDKLILLQGVHKKRGFPNFPCKKIKSFLDELFTYRVSYEPPDFESVFVDTL